MSDENKTRGQLINELIELRQLVDKLNSRIEHYSREIKRLRKGKRLFHIVYKHTHLKKTRGKFQMPRRDVAGILESISDAFYAVDSDWRLTYVNHRAEERWHRRREELLGTVVWDIFPNYEITMNYQEHQRAMRERVPVHFETFSPNLQAWIETNIYPATDGGLLICFRDITECKRAEDELRKSEEKSRDLILYAPSGIYEIDFLGPKFKSVNDVMCHYLGYTREELLTMDPFDLLDAQSKNAFQDRIRKSLAGEKTDNSVEYKVKAKYGRVFYAILNITFVYENGIPVGAMVIAHDITERKKMEETLRRAEQEKKLILDTISEPVVLYDTDMRIVWTNKAAGVSGGSTPEQLVGRQCYEVWNQLSSPCPGCPVRKALDTGQLHENEITTPDGKTWIVRGHPIKNENGNVIGIVEVALDLTQRKQFEKEMTRLDRLNLVGEIAAGIAHEIRNPITVVRGFLQILMRKEPDSKRIEYFNLMIEELDRANSIITEFLSLARNKGVELKENKLNNIIKAMLPLIQADALKGSKQIDFELGDIPDLQLDQKEIRQLLLNLVRNGFDAMPTGGILRIKTYQEGGKVVLAVQDHGKGIEPEVLEKIGTPFFTTKDNGTGLGLAVCFSIAQRHNATINFETGSNGTTFFVRLDSDTRKAGNSKG